eukprot:NODE_381_length_9671_cov_0.208838.p4 type:complete len:326 gc:universal NODE_381_length_9671_cov_0.208838:9137-8160(-)
MSLMFWKPFKQSAIWELGKPRLSALVTLTTLGGYAIHKNDSDKKDSGSLMQMLATVVGTGLCAYSANTFNQLFEYPMDAQMVRTRTRMLTSGRCLPMTALGVGIGAGISGIAILSFVNYKTAVLGATTIGLYAFIYTPLKRFHHSSLWAGALVGAIPPLMGYTARNDSFDLQSLILPVLLFMWQFPHFNALSHFTKASYAIAGYPLLSITRPFKNSQLAFKYSVRILGLTCLLPLIDRQTSSYFVLTSSLVNIPLIYGAAKFHQSVCQDLNSRTPFSALFSKLLGNAQSSVQSSRRLFFTSLVHLPVIIGLYIYHRGHKATEQRS